ncbi:MAG TPA: tripartite tricarboxylate transporter substrate binding protein [Xanthobacteraceae bacterium]|nr:tripartite tricarboxylate transporter substrate binding protein [Xanthobacteraceae bacterium]
MRRSSFVAAALAAVLAAGGAAAQDYPNRPIRLVVAFAAGGTTDFVARQLAERAKASLGQSIVVENKPGANGAIGAEYVAKSEPDGYTLFFSTAGALAINPTMRSDLPYDPIKDFTPIVPVARNTVLFAVNPTLGVATAQEMIARAKEKPGTITVAITGVGAISHLAIEMLQIAAGIKLQYVPYRGAGQAVADFIGGQLNAMSAEVPVLMPQIKAGKATILAVSAQNRSDVLPEVPTFAELGYPDVIADNWSGVLAPPKTPAAIVARLNQAFNAVVRDPEVRRRFAENGVSTIGGTPEDLTELIKSETARWRKVVKETGVKSE